MNHNLISNAIFATAALAVVTLNPVQAQVGQGCSSAVTNALLNITRPLADAAPSCPTLVGTWEVKVSPDGAPPFVAYNVFSADGNSTEFDNSNPPSQQSIAVGPWKKTGAKEYAMLEINQLFDAQGNFAGTLKVKAVITLADNGDTFTSKFNFTVLDPDGNEVFQGTGTATGKRVSLD
jgi:hypothetical protein